MDHRLEEALKFANYQQTLSIQRKVLKEKLDTRLTYGHNGGIFKITKELISFVQMLISMGRCENLPIVDSNENPILIEDLNKFQTEILDRYFEATFDYLNAYNELKKSRSVEKLINL